MPKKDDVTRDLRRLHCEDLNLLYFAPNIVRLIKLQIMRSVGMLLALGQYEMRTKYLLGILKRTVYKIVNMPRNSLR